MAALPVGTPALKPPPMTRLPAGQVALAVPEDYLATTKAAPGGIVTPAPVESAELKPPPTVCSSPASSVVPCTATEQGVGRPPHAEESLTPLTVSVAEVRAKAAGVSSYETTKLKTARAIRKE